MLIKTKIKIKTKNPAHNSIYTQKYIEVLMKVTFRLNSRQLQTDSKITMTIMNKLTL